MSDVEALSTIVGVLRDLDEKDQIRILSSVEAFLGLTITRGPHILPSQRRSENAEHADVDVRGGAFSQDRTISIKDFLREKAPQSDIERVACLAYYLSHFRETPHFKTVDISSLNVEGAQPKFANASNAVDNARARGYLIPTTQGNKQLSAVGEQYVEALPDRDAARNTIQSARKKVAKKSKARKK